MSAPTLSFICPSNDKKVLDEMLIASLKKQKNQDFELIVLDAKELGFKSASEALNYGTTLTKGKYFVFCHQDIEFLENDAVDKIIHYFETCEFGFAGVAGLTPDPTGYKGYRVHSSVTEGANHHHVGAVVDEAEECIVVDECCMFCKKDAFKGFDNYGPTWHFYGVEYSQRCQSRHEKVLILPVNIYHLSTGDLNASFWETLERYAKKNKHTKILVSCCGVWKNNWFLPILCFLHKHKRLESFLRKIKHIFVKQEAQNV